MSRKNRSGRKNRQHRNRTPDHEMPFDGWISMLNLEVEGGDLPPGKLQMASCHKAGDVFVRAIEGRHQARPVYEIASRLAELQPLIEAMSLASAHDPRQDPAERLEMLENILEFEMVRPCGCDHHPAAPAGPM
jgi:hypothetical protein